MILELKADFFSSVSDRQISDNFLVDISVNFKIYLMWTILSTR